MKKIIAGILIGLIPTAIMVFLGYFWLPKENKVLIQNIQKHMDCLSSKVDSANENKICIEKVEHNIERIYSQIDCVNDSLNSIKLFIVTAHPDKDVQTLSSAKKLQELEFKEVAALAMQIDKYQTACAFSQGASSDPRIAKIMVHYEIDQNDLQNYWYMVGKQNFNSNNDPNLKMPLPPIEREN